MPGQGDPKETAIKAGRGLAAPERQVNAGVHASIPVDDDDREMADQDADENDNKQSKGLADLMQKGGTQPLYVHGRPCLAPSASWLQM